MSEDPYHWIRLTNLETGATIPRAHWGRGVLRAVLTHAQSARELIYEQIRRAEFPDRPSRLESIFLCGNIDSARNFGRQHRQNEVCYRVEVLDDNAPRFIANWNMMPPRTADQDEVIQCAREYWRGGFIPQHTQEIVVASDVRVIERVELLARARG